MGFLPPDLVGGPEGVLLPPPAFSRRHTLWPQFHCCCISLPPASSFSPPPFLCRRDRPAGQGGVHPLFVGEGGGGDVALWWWVPSWEPIRPVTFPNRRPNLDIRPISLFVAATSRLLSKVVLSQGDVRDRPPVVERSGSRRRRSESPKSTQNTKPEFSRFSRGREGEFS